MGLILGTVRSLSKLFLTRANEGTQSEITIDPRGRMYGSDGPFGGGVAVVPTDGLALGEHRGLWIGTGGTLVVTMLGADGTTSNTITTTVGDGSIFPFQVQTVKAATGASGIVAGW